MVVVGGDSDSNSLMQAKNLEVLELKQILLKIVTYLVLILGVNNITILAIYFNGQIGIICTQFL